MTILRPAVTAAAVLLLAACSSQGDDDSAASRGSSDPSPTAREVVPGPAATWDLAPGQRLAPSSTSFTADVSRLACNNGVTGEIADPLVEVTTTRVVVTFSTVDPDPRAATCPSNPPVQHQVRLDVPLKGRTLVDGRCLPGGAAETTLMCDGGGIRWTPAD